MKLKAGHKLLCPLARVQLDIFAVPMTCGRRMCRYDRDAQQVRPWKLAMTSMSWMVTAISTLG